MQAVTLHKFESLCTQDSPPECQSRCPLHVEAGTLADLVGKGQIDEARKVLERFLPLASLSARLCEGVCRETCLRKDLGGSINIPLLEAYIVSVGRETKVFPLPSTGHKAALVGSGLSALAAAFELAKKGHKPFLFHKGPIGGRLKHLSAELAPPRVLEQTVESLKKLKVKFAEVESFDRLWFDELSKEYEAVFLGLDDETVDPVALGFADVQADPVTGRSYRKGVFLGEHSSAYPHIVSLTSGKRAATSMDRLFQGVDPKTAREKEQITPSKLVVDLTGVESASEVAAAPGTQPTERQARLEAQRCLNCACLSCLPACPYLRSRKGYPKKYAREFYNNIITAFGIRHSNIHINSCAQCGLCGVVCPNGADLGKFVESARFDMVAQNHMPVSAHEFALEDQVFSNSEQASFSRPQLGFESSKHLFFPGCQLTASLPKAVKALYLHLTRRLEGGVGLFSACCGAPARWSGREILTRKTVSFLLATWEKAGFPTVILACPSCRLFFLKELPQIPIKSLWTVLAQLPSPKRPLAIDSPLFIHDPCAARFDAESQDGVRALMATIGQKIVEPKMTRKYTLCCGYGGLAAHANPEMGRRYVFERTNASPGPFLAWCVMCRDRFLETGQKAYHPLDLLFSEDGVNEDDVEQDGVKRNDVDHDGVYQNNVKQDDVKRNDVDHDGVYQNNVKQDGVDEDEIDSDKRRPGVPNLPAAPNISDRRRNRSFFKRLMLQTVWLEPAEEKDMSLNIDIPDSVLKEMEARRILFDDVAMVLQEAEKSGPMFVNPQTKLMIATLKPRQVTFWVEYEELANGVKKVHRAWCHRMTLPNIAGQALESPASEEGFARDGGRV